MEETGHERAGFGYILDIIKSRIEGVHFITCFLVCENERMIFGRMIKEIKDTLEFHKARNKGEIGFVVLDTEFTYRCALCVR